MYKTTKSASSLKGSSVFSADLARDAVQKTDFLNFEKFGLGMAVGLQDNFNHSLVIWALLALLKSTVSYFCDTIACKPLLNMTSHNQ